MIYLDTHQPLPHDGEAASKSLEATPGVAFYLAVEEFAARFMPPADYFFMWQVEPSVIFGRNQVMDNEVNVAYCRQHNIKMYRRKSGGGCVYADMSNVMLSYVTPDDDVSATFSRYLDMVCQTLRTIGLDARPSGNNDIMLPPVAGAAPASAAASPAYAGAAPAYAGAAPASPSVGYAAALQRPAVPSASPAVPSASPAALPRKVSGNAIYHIPGRIIAHGTLLYDTDMEHMLNAITPSHAKLSKHGVESVRQRICLLKDYTALPLSEIKARIRNHLCDSTYALTAANYDRVRSIEAEYLDPAFITGR